MTTTRLLIIEDDINLLKLYAQLFRIDGCEVWEAEDFTTALNLLETHDFDICLSDAHVGTQNALDILPNHPHWRGREADIIIHSGAVDMRQKSETRGMRFLPKPSSVPHLLETVLGIRAA